MFSLCLVQDNDMMSKTGKEAVSVNRTEYKNQHAKEHDDRINFTLPIGEKERIRHAAPDWECRSMNISMKWLRIFKVCINNLRDALPFMPDNLFNDFVGDTCHGQHGNAGVACIVRAVRHVQSFDQRHSVTIIIISIFEMFSL